MTATKIGNTTVFAVVLLAWTIAGMSAGTALAAPVITDWSSTGGHPQNKDNNKDVMYLLQGGDTVTFQVTATGAEAYEWKVNKATQAGATGNSLAWTVPNEKGTWEIHLKVTGGGAEVHQEWVVSTKPASEAPDFFDYFTDGKILGTRETDPWGRTHAECITYTDFDGQCPRRFLRRSGSYGPFARYSGSSGTIVFKFRYTKPYTSTAYGSAIGAGWTRKWNFGEYEFGIRLSKQNEGHFYAGSAGDGGGHPMIEGQRFKRRPEGEVMKSYGRSMDLAFLNYGGNPGVQGKESYNVGWHEMRMIYDGRFYHVVVDGRVYPRFAGALVEPEKGGNFFKTREGECLITSIKMSATAWDYSDPTNEGWLDCLEIYTDKYLYPPPRIVVENYPEHYQWNAAKDKLIPAAFRSGVVISGRNSQGGPVTLADIAQAINNPAVFKYDPAQKTADCYTNIKIDTGSFLELKDETLNMHSAGESNELRLASPADLRVIRSKIIGVNKPFRWAIPSEWEPTLYPWGYPKPDTTCAPDFWFENGEDEYVFRGRFEIEDSEIGPCGFLYFSSPLTLSLKNTKLDLVTMDAYPNPYEANSKHPRAVSGQSHSFGMRLQLMVDDFALKNLTVTGPDADNPITWVLLGGDQVCKFKTIRDSRFKDTNISLRYGADKVGVSWDRSSYGCEPYTNTLCMLNTLMENGAVSLDTRDTRLMSKYYTNIKVINSNGEPVEGANITIVNEQDNEHYPTENLSGYRTYTTWHEEGHFSYGSGMTTLVLVKADPLDGIETDATGFTPLPSEQSSTIVLTDYVQYKEFRGKLRGDFNEIAYGMAALKVAWLAMPVKDRRVDFTYTISAEKDGESKTITGVNPGTTWYRPDANTPTHTVVIVLGGDVAVCNRRVFYNSSAFDGDNPAANTDDDGAIAPDKTPLLPGGTATFANYTAYSRGINGIMVDIVGLAGAPTAADFTFKVGNDNTPGSWPDAPAPSSITVRAGAGLGGSDRITIVWADNAIQKQWLQVTVKATAATGLAVDDVFYFGNAIGETGNCPTDARVTPTDQVNTRNNPHTLKHNPAGIDDAYDFNRDKKVGPTDEIIARNNGTNSSTALKLITAP